MVRSIVGVIVSLIAMSIIVFALSIAIWFALGLDGVLKPGTFDDKPVLAAWSIAASIIGALAGGWLCARISRSRTAVIVLGALSFALGLMNAAMQHAKPAPGPREQGLSVMDAIQRRREPAWFTLLVPVLGAAAVLAAGGAIRAKSPPTPD